MFESLNEWFKAIRLSQAARKPFRRAPPSNLRVSDYFRGLPSINHSSTDTKTIGGSGEYYTIKDL